MKKVFDLSSYLTEEKAVIKIGEDNFAINDGFNDMLKIDALTRSNSDAVPDAEFIGEFLTIALGEESAKRVVELNLPVRAYMDIMGCIQASFTGEMEDADKGDAPSK